MNKDYENRAYNIMREALDHICGSTRSLISDSEIRNLNIGLCLVQCGQVEHPLVKRMAFKKRQYEGSWSNMRDIEELLYYWLKTEVALENFSDAQRIQEIGDELYKAFIRIQSNLSWSNDFINNQKTEVIKHNFNWYTFFMYAHVARNLFAIMKDGDFYNEAIAVFNGYVDIIDFYLKSQDLEKTISSLAFSLSFFSMPEAIADFQQHHQDRIDAIAPIIIEHIKNNYEYFASEHKPIDKDLAVDNEIAHLLMDLHIAGKLNSEDWEKGFELLESKMKKVMNRNPINLQALTRLTRAMGELCCGFETLPERLSRYLSDLYSQNILSEIERRVLDERAYQEPVITDVSHRISNEHNLGDTSTINLSFDRRRAFFLDILNAPEHDTMPELEFIDVVKPPDRTLEQGGDCDCMAALYAALLTSVAGEPIHVYHLEIKDEKTNNYHNHAVTCIPCCYGDTHSFFCFDRYSGRQKECIPILRTDEDETVAEIDFGNKKSMWQVKQHRILNPFVEFNKRTNNKNTYATTQGLTINPQHTANIYPDVMYWILVHADISHSHHIAKEIDDYMNVFKTARWGQFEDIIDRKSVV